MTTIDALLETGAGDATAITAPGGTPLTYEALRALRDRVRGQLAAKGIGVGDRVAIVTANGPLAATSFVAVAATCCAAPLNPNYKEAEYTFYLEDLGPKLLIVDAGSTNESRSAAEKLGIEVVELRPGLAAGDFDLFDESAEGTAPGPDDPALVLHTSGTTSRPKIVPLTQRNVAASARNISETLALTPQDHCLNIMPLFHIHGLIAAMLASLKAGAAITCTPGFNALKFFEWAVEAKPSWYTAVPTMHQAILVRAKRNAEALGKLNLRFIRSSSASLPPAVMRELEDVFGAPVIESYGMTEAAHQMASNQLPPGLRKPGFVGSAAGPKVGIFDQEGHEVAQGALGEVCIKGENVTLGYENNPDANAKNFFDGWFRTGDEGFLDEDGFLKITGRLKEIINRGGEKVSPLEVDDVLMEHPAVQQVVTFAKPHKMLGEDVAAAIVLAPDASATEAELKAFAGEKLASFKVPGTYVFLDEIPKGATGKLQRIGLADKLGLGA